MLWVFRQERRRKDDDDQVPAEPAAADERRGAGVRDGSGARGSRRQVAHFLRPRPRRVLSVDDGPRRRWVLRIFRPKWNSETERALLEQFRLDPRQKTSHLSKGQRTQLALVIAICPEPELLILDEPTSGLDPIVRREFIRTVIGAYQDGDPGRRTVFVSTHLISEFEGLIDEFTIIDGGREVLTLDADAARARHEKSLEEIFVTTLQPHGVTA